MSGKDFRINLYRFLICGLASGFFAIPANGQKTDNLNHLAGSYQIDLQKSQNITPIIENASRQNNLSPADRIDLQTKLTSPETLSIEVNGAQVVLTSSNSNPITLTADGSLETAYGTNGIQVSIRTSLLKDTLKVTSLYDNTDYSITFKSINSGRNLQVTRTVKTNYLQQTVTGQSFYNRTNSPPVFAGNYDTDSRFSGGSFFVPKGTVLETVLENYISTNNSQNNDVFRLTVLTPGKYQGTLIEGYLSGIERTDGISGTAKMTLNFQRIKLPTGQIYEFAGIIQSINVAADTSIKSTDESQVKSSNKTNETIKRGVLGAGIGAVIGAIVNGKNGAVIGAAIGGGGGIGTVLLEGKNDLKLQRGSQINIQSTSPN